MVAVGGGCDPALVLKAPKSQRHKKDRKAEIAKTREKRVAMRTELADMRKREASHEAALKRLSEELAAEKQRSAGLLQQCEWERSTRIRLEGELDEVRRNYRNMRRGWREQATPFD